MATDLDTETRATAQAKMRRLTEIMAIRLGPHETANLLATSLLFLMLPMVGATETAAKLRQLADDIEADEVVN